MYGWKVVCQRCGWQSWLESWEDVMVAELGAHECAVGAENPEKAIDLQDRRLNEIEAYTKRAVADCGIAESMNLAPVVEKLGTDLLRLVEEARRNRLTLFWAYLNEQEDPQTAIGSWHTHHVAESRDYIGLIQWHRSQDRPWEQTAKGSITFPATMADQVIRTIQAQAAKTKETEGNEDHGTT